MGLKGQKHGIRAPETSLSGARKIRVATVLVVGTPSRARNHSVVAMPPPCARTQATCPRSHHAPTPTRVNMPVVSRIASHGASIRVPPRGIPTSPRAHVRAPYAYVASGLMPSREPCRRPSMSKSFPKTHPGLHFSRRFAQKWFRLSLEIPHNSKKPS